MTPQRALIEAAEEILIPMEKEIMEGGGVFSDTQFEKLRAAISSAKAAEEGVEVIPVNEAVFIAENTLTPSSNITQIRSVEKVVAALRKRR